MIPHDQLSDVCKRCMLKNVAAADIVDKDTGEVLVRRGDFIIDCDGIPSDYGQRRLSITPPALISRIGEQNVINIGNEIDDPVGWAKKNILVFNPDSGITSPWLPQGATQENIERYNLDPESAIYQATMARCTAKRSVYRIGRRSGKTWTLVLRALHKMVKNERYRIMLIAPSLPQLDLFFGQLHDFIMRSPTLSSSLKRFVQSPNRLLTLHNRSQIIGFIAGSTAIRGQAADEVFIDEADYLGTSDMSDVMAILSEHSETVLSAATTPTGKREQFYEWDNDPEFRSFHFPSMCRPTWTKKMEREQKRLNPGMKYVHEILADYGEMDAGVFKPSHIDAALELGEYHYGQLRPQPGWQYAIGVDWNPVNGTEVVVVGADMTLDTPIHYVVDINERLRVENTQLEMVSHIIEMFGIWKPFALYVDKGAGFAQIELLEAYSNNAEPDTETRRLRDVLRAIDSGSKIDVRHPIEGNNMRVYAKPAMIDNAVRFFEARAVGLSSGDPELARQLKGYIVKATNGERISYTTVSKDVKDHRLDALVLALFAFTMEFSSLGNPTYVKSIGYTDMELRGIRISSNTAVAIATDPKARQRLANDLDEKSQYRSGYVKPSDLSGLIGTSASPKKLDAGTRSGIREKQTSGAMNGTHKRAPIKRSTFRR